MNNIIEYLNSFGIKKGVIIGSSAFSILKSESSDIDIIMKIDDIPDGYDVTGKDILVINGDIEIHVSRESYALDAIYSSSFLYDTTGDDIIFADKLVLFALKSGHVHRKLIKWEKHLYDYTVLKNECIHEHGYDFKNLMVGNLSVNQLISYSKNHNDNVYGKEFKVPLNVSKEKFFDDAVKKFIEHDFLHEVFSHYDKPLYTKLQNDEQLTVYCHKSLWDTLPWCDKVRTVLEECYVIASERYLIPDMIKVKSTQLDTLNPSQAVMVALKMVCTTLTSGYFRAFAIDNYFQIISMIDFEYYNKLVPVLESYYEND